MKIIFIGVIRCECIVVLLFMVEVKIRFWVLCWICLVSIGEVFMVSFSVKLG